MRHTGIALLTLIATSIGGAAHAQICGPIYRVQPQQVLERQVEQRMRVVYDTIYEDQEVVTQRPVLRTRMEKRSYTVTKPVVETSTVQERYTVLRPVTKTEWIDRSYDETSYVTETQERLETYTSYRPVTETTYQPQSYVVQRPVTETQYQTQQRVSYSPVTTYQNTVVDQGQYYAQQYYQPGDTRYSLRWVRGGYTTDPYGYGAYRRGGLGWVPYTSPGTTYAQLAYKPNPVQVAVPQTQLMPQVEQIQVPVQVTRMQNEVVEQQVPIQHTRMEPVQETRRVPYQVQRPVTRRVEKKEPVQRVEWVEQEMIRPKTVKRTSYKLETVEKEVPVQYYETQSVTTTVKVPRRVARYEPYYVTKLVPKTIQSPVVLSYYDAYSLPTSQGVSSWAPSQPTTNSLPSPSEEISYGASRPAVPEISSESDMPAEAGEQRLRKIETVEPDSSSGEPASQEETGDDGEDGGELELSPSAT